MDSKNKKENLAFTFKRNTSQYGFEVKYFSFSDTKEPKFKVSIYNYDKMSKARIGFETFYLDMDVLNTIVNSRSLSILPVKRFTDTKSFDLFCNMQGETAKEYSFWFKINNKKENKDISFKIDMFDYCCLRSFVNRCVAYQIQRRCLEANRKDMLIELPKPKPLPNIVNVTSSITPDMVENLLKTDEGKNEIVKILANDKEGLKSVFPNGGLIENPNKIGVAVGVFETKEGDLAIIEDSKIKVVVGKCKFCHKKTENGKCLTADCENEVNLKERSKLIDKAIEKENKNGK